MSRLSSPPDSQPAPPVLEYGNAADRAEPLPPPFGVRLAFLVLALPAAASPFLPFTFNVAPVDVWSGFLGDPGTPDGELIVLATPFFVGVALAVWQLRRLIRPGTRAAERFLAYVIAIACAALTTYFVTRLVGERDISLREVIQVTPGPTVLVAGAVLTLWLRSRGRRDGAATTALATAYSANAAMLFCPMFSPDHSGWWVSLIGCVCLILLTLLTTARAWRLR
jgi:hypothetical protein